MGSGKSCVGKELAKQMKRDFFDSDREIEQAAGMPITDIFEMLGEDAFRVGERKIMLRLLGGHNRVIATGGGAFVQPQIRKAIKKTAISVWLKADLSTLLSRVSRTRHRPLLRHADPAATLQALMDTRYPVYAEADIAVVTENQTPREMAHVIHAQVENFSKRFSGDDK